MICISLSLKILTAGFFIYIYIRNFRKDEFSNNNLSSNMHTLFILCYETQRALQFKYIAKEYYFHVMISSNSEKEHLILYINLYISWQFKDKGKIYWAAINYKKSLVVIEVFDIGKRNNIYEY